MTEQPGILHNGWRSAQGIMGRLLDPLHPRWIDLAMRSESARRWQPDAPDTYCPRCGASAGRYGASPAGCAHCLHQAIAWERLARLSAYGAPVRPWVLAFKYHHQWRWAQWFGQRLAQALPADINDSRAAVCPVPMHWRRRLVRGYNHSWLLARALAAERGWPVLEVLQRVHHRPQQTTLAPSRRAANVRGSVRVRPGDVDLSGCDWILVDDVKTTGSTLQVCARALRKHGARSIRVAVICVADPHGADFAWV